MALILSIETATEVCSVALAKDGKLVDCKESFTANSHALNSGIFVQTLLQENHISSRELDAIAVSEGPGSYTGLRIGVSLAKGLCFGLQIPLIAIKSLKALSYGAREEYGQYPVYIPMIDARRMEVYAALYDDKLNEIKAVEPLILSEESFKDQAFEKAIIFGDGAKKCKDFIQDERIEIYTKELFSAKNMIQLAEEKFLAGKFEDVAYFDPFYLKEFQAKVSKIKGLK